jgi:hypothetical protein
VNANLKHALKILLSTCTYLIYLQGQEHSKQCPGISRSHLSTISIYLSIGG